MGRFIGTAGSNLHSSRNNRTKGSSTGTTVKSRFIPIEKLGICSPIGITKPIDKPEMSQREIEELEKQIVPVFKDFDKKGLNSRQI